jgi:hypothetical protein
MDDPSVYIRIGNDPEAESYEANVGDRIVELTADVAGAIRNSIGAIATGLRPDLEGIQASKATVKLGVKVVAKAGGLAALITEVGGEGTIEVSIEFVS